MLTAIVYNSSDFSTSYWSGGTTTQLFISPEGASYADRRFDFRISTALVELEESKFTLLPGVKRYLTPLCEKGFELQVNGSRVALPFGSVLEFSGEDDITCYGSGRDLNLMLKGREGGMRFLRAGEETELPRAEYLFVYAVDDTEITLGRCADRLELTKGSFARILCRGTLVSSGRAVLFTVY